MGKKASQRDLDSWLARLPGVSTDIKWGADLCYLVRDKMFCVYCLEGEGKGSLSFKAGEDRFLELTDRPGFVPAPYLARAHWVKIDDTAIVPRQELESLLRNAYELIVAKLPKKVQRELASG